jgi:hypothetical protein
MSSMHALTGVALAALVAAGCDSTTPAANTGPIALTTGTPEYQMRQQQLQNYRSGGNTGTGSFGGSVGGLRTDGTIERSGAGAPATQNVPAPRRPGVY